MFVLYGQATHQQRRVRSLGLGEGSFHRFLELAGFFLFQPHVLLQVRPLLRYHLLDEDVDIAIGCGTLTVRAGRSLLCGFHAGLLDVPLVVEILVERPPRYPGVLDNVGHTGQMVALLGEYHLCTL